MSISGAVEAGTRFLERCLAVPLAKGEATGMRIRAKGEVEANRIRERGEAEMVAASGMHSDVSGLDAWRRRNVNDFGEELAEELNGEVVNPHSRRPLLSAVSTAQYLGDEDTHIRRLLAKLLARDVRKAEPPTLRTISILEKMTTEDAKDFVYMAERLVVPGRGFIPDLYDSHENAESRAIQTTMLYRLDSAGLVNVSLADFRAPVDKDGCFSLEDRRCWVHSKGKLDTTSPWVGHTLTPEGRQLYAASGIVMSIDGWRDFATWVLKKHSVTLRLAALKDEKWERLFDHDLVLPRSAWDQNPRLAEWRAWETATRTTLIDKSETTKEPT